jgi:hypothetical protein
MSVVAPVPAANAHAATIAEPRAATIAEPMVPLRNIVLPVPPMLRGPRVRDNAYLDEALSLAARGGPGEDDPGAAVGGALAVVADPSSTTARFAEACLLAQVGQHQLAAIVIRTLTEPESCAACNDALVEARNGVCRFDGEVLALANGRTPSRLRTAAETVLASLNSGDVTVIEPYLDEGTVTLASSCSVCDEDRITKTRLDHSKFRAMVANGPERIARDALVFARPVLLFCDDRCCSGPTGFLNHSASFVTSICFRGPADAPKLASIDTLDG